MTILIISGNVCNQLIKHPLEYQVESCPELLILQSLVKVDLKEGEENCVRFPFQTISKSKSLTKMNIFTYEKIAISKTVDLGALEGDGTSYINPYAEEKYREAIKRQCMGDEDAEEEMSLEEVEEEGGIKKKGKRKKKKENQRMTTFIIPSSA